MNMSISIFIIFIIQFGLFLRYASASNSVDSLNRCLKIKFNHIECIKLLIETFRVENSHINSNFISETKNITNFYSNQSKCVFEHCLTPLVSCVLDVKCRKATICNTQCEKKSDVDGNYFLT